MMIEQEPQTPTSPVFELDRTPIAALVRALYRVTTVQRGLGRHSLAELGSQGFSALAVIGVYGPLRVGEVAGRLSVDLSVASRQIAALVSQGYVERRRDPADRRAHEVALTATGRDVLRESHRRMIDALSDALSAWPQDDLIRLAGSLERLREDYLRHARPAATDGQEADR